MKAIHAIALLFLFALVQPACATAPSEQDYKSRVEAAYARAERSMERGDYVDAIARYNAIRSRYPYSRFATLSELRLGDANYEQDKYATAIAQYRNFIKLHPNHERVPYASFMVAESFEGQMPDEWFHLPPAYERELASARDAEREYAYFLKKYPNSEFEKDARRKLALVRRRLADHEMYVAQFYLKRDNPRAAAMRLTYLLDNYSGVGLDARSLFLLARSYLQLGDTRKARTALDDLIENFPNDSLAREAQAYLRRYPLPPSDK